jgi:hypothetical protein
MMIEEPAYLTKIEVGHAVLEIGNLKKMRKKL